LSDNSAMAKSVQTRPAAAPADETKRADVQRPIAAAPGGDMTPARFIAKWSRSQLSERAASQEHFIDLCHLLSQPTPAERDATGAEYTFDKSVSVTAGASKGAKGDRGFADVWWRGKFGWEYKRKDKHADLGDAYRQLCQYREALENPPLLVVCDIARTEIHTNFTGTAKQLHTIALADLDKPETGALGTLRRVFTDPDWFRPTATSAKITEDVAKQFAGLAEALHKRGHDPHTTARFLMKCMFCLFAEDVDLLPDKLFRRMATQWHDAPDQLTDRLTELFAKMRTGGAFGFERIPWFNGGLFDETPALPLTEPEVGVLILAAKQDWSAVEPAIFGTLFERSLDPTKRAQIGAHYTSREDILLVVEPVIMAPLRRQWQEVRAKCDAFVEHRSESQRQRQRGSHAKGDTKPETFTQHLEDELHGFLTRLSSLRILDPACGSGNFLYVAIQQLVALEKQVITYAAGPDIAVTLFPQVRPTQLHGIEINPYAAELAQVVIWIGYLQWMRENGFNAPRDPILQQLQTIENRDAILDLSDPKSPKPAQWPEADFIVGNPPFLGGNLIRQGLGDAYVEQLFDAFDLPRFSDLCCYWYELARRQIAAEPRRRTGLLATQGIRGGVNRVVLERIKSAGHIFMAWSDREWILDGAAVHVSIVGFAGANGGACILDGRDVTEINANLTSGLDLTAARPLTESLHIQHEADKKGADFDIRYERAREILAGSNVSGDSMAHVCRPWCNGRDVTQRTRAMWIVDFGAEVALEVAAKYEAAFEYVRVEVSPKYAKTRTRWWLHERPRPAMREAIAPLPRYIATPMLTKHRLFVWLDHNVLPDHQLVVFVRADDYFFGALHSSIHELWARRMGTQLREVESGFRYTPTTCFETFPLPWAPGKEPTDHPAYERIAAAARELNDQRERWLNPPEWIEPLAKTVDALEKFDDVPPEARPLIRQSAIMALAAKDARLKKRTLTNLYNERPTWLKLAHEKLDRAVLAAYAATDPEGGWSEDWAQVWTDSGAGQALPAGHALTDKRRAADQAVLANLLPLNQMRSSPADCQASPAQPTTCAPKGTAT
jgi:hypothetical protein